LSSLTGNEDPVITHNQLFSYRMAGKKERIFRHCNEPLLKILKLWLLYDSYVSRWSMECFTGLVAKLNLTFLFFFFWFPEISSFVHVGSLGLSLEGFPSNWRSAEQQNCFEKKSAIYGWNWNKGCVRVCLPPCGCTEPAYDKNNMIRVAFPLAR
jgi:hypothetical protein